MALTALRVKNAKRGRHGDGRGLYLEVKPSGSRSWVLRIQHRGVRRDFGLGSAYDVSLADARIAALETRRRFQEGKDPAADRRAGRKRARSFEAAARKCYEALRPGWKDERHKVWISSLENHVFPMIGSKPVHMVDVMVVRDVLEPIWLKVPETAKRVLQRINTVLEYAHLHGWISHAVPLSAVRKGLPRQTGRSVHHAAMPYKDVPAFMARLHGLPATPARDALKLLIYTASRSGEVRFAAWKEFDLKAGIWTVPEGRMKAGIEHVVPLPDIAVSLLKRLHRERDKECEYVFARNGQPLSNMAKPKVLRDMKIADLTVHGFRSTFTDWTAEQTDYAKEIADKALAHQIPDRVEAAYRRTDFFDKRRKLMEEWVGYVESGEAPASDE